MKTGNLLSPVPSPLPTEIVDCLLTTSDLRIERIVSTGQCSPPDFWYRQEEDEWVVVIKGEATLRFDPENAGADTVVLTEGMYIDIPAGLRHRVEHTSTLTETIWLAIFYRRQTS